jgi:hypothetical protein
MRNEGCPVTTSDEFPGPLHHGVWEVVVTDRGDSPADYDRTTIQAGENGHSSNKSGCVSEMNTKCIQFE